MADANVGESVPAERVSADNFASFELTTIENEEVVAVAVFASVNRIEIALVPAEVGVPEITPVVEFKLKPTGKVPEATE